MKPISFSSDNSKLGQLLNMELPWPVFHEADGHLTYTREQMSGKLILGENGASALENMFAQRSQTMQHLRDALLIQFLEVEPKFKKEFKKFINQFVGFLNQRYPERDQLKEKEKAIEDGHSTDDVEDITNQLKELPTRKQAIQILLKSIDLNTYDKKHSDYLELAIMLDNQIGKALHAQNLCTELRDNVTRLTRLLLVGETKKLDQHESANRIIANLQEISNVLQSANRFTSPEALNVANQDLLTEIPFVHLTQNLETFGKATKIAEENITTIINSLENSFPPEQHSQSRRSM